MKSVDRQLPLYLRILRCATRIQISRDLLGLRATVIGWSTSRQDFVAHAYVARKLLHAYSIVYEDGSPSVESPRICRPPQSRSARRTSKCVLVRSHPVSVTLASFSLDPLPLPPPQSASLKLYPLSRDLYTVADRNETAIRETT